MGIPTELRELWANTRSSSSSSSCITANSPNEPSMLHSQNSSVQDAVVSGFKSACIAGAVAAVPTLVGCRVIPWAKHNLNHTAQALIISSAAVAGFFITADKAILGRTKENAEKQYVKST